MLDALLSIPLNIVVEEFKVCLVSFDGVAKIVLLDVLLVVAEEATDGLDAGCTLEVLLVDQLFNSLLEVLVFAAYLLDDADESALEALQVPVLVDNLVNDTALEDLSSLVGEQEHQVVHLAYAVAALVLCQLLGAPLWEHLLTKEEHEILDIILFFISSLKLLAGELHVLLGMLEAQLNAVEKRPEHGLHESLLVL